ncbi:MAG: DUF4465 domain-containing protein, partial [Prevotellaceae bacterium]|nr:DUF4465 domain-containing protein [Prevotellaceae bacterium]
MKKVFTFFLITAFAIGNLQAAPGDTITLDLSLPLNPASFTYTPAGYWTETYNEDDYLMIDFDNFSFSHAAFSDYNYWYGFTVCTSGDNANYIGAYGWDYTHQWGNMAGGGIKTDASGAVLKDDNGKPQVEQGIPYMLAYADSPTAAQTIIYGADEPYQAVGVYVNISPWAYYGNIAGDGFAEGLTAEGDYFKLLIHALDEDYEDNGKVVEHYFAKFENGALTQSPDWEWVDLSPLGKVYGLSYTLESTDANSYGMRTAAYFALDKLQVCKEAPTPVEELVTVGASETTVAGLMLGGYYGFERHAALYTHAELANANWQEITSAKISSLAFKLGAVTAPNDNREIKIYLKEVTDAEL